MLMTGLKEEAGKKVGQRVEDGKKIKQGSKWKPCPSLQGPASAWSCRVCSYKLLAFCYPTAVSYWLDLEEDKLEAFSAQGRYGESWVRPCFDRDKSKQRTQRSAGVKIAHHREQDYQIVSSQYSPNIFHQIFTIHFSLHYIFIHLCACVREHARLSHGGGCSYRGQRTTCGRHFSSHLAGSRDRTQVSRLGGKRLSLRRPLTGPAIFWTLGLS